MVILYRYSEGETASGARLSTERTSLSEWNRQRMEETTSSIKKDDDERMEDNVANTPNREYEENIVSIPRDYDTASGHIDRPSKSTDSIFMTPSVFLKFSIEPALERRESVCDLPQDIRLRSHSVYTMLY